MPGFWDALLWHLGYATNFYNAFTNMWAGATAHLWTLSVEEQFYIFWPWIILFLPRRALLPVICAILATGSLFRSIFVAFGWSRMALYVLTPASLDAFAAGALLALVRRRHQQSGDGTLRRIFVRGSLILGVPVAVVSFSSLAWPENYLPVFAIGANLGLSLVFVWLIDRAADGFKGNAGRLLTWKPLLYTGKISYGLYLFHMIMIHFLRIALASPPLAQFKPIISRHSASVLTLTAMTFAVASASWFAYERPLLKLKRYFPYTRLASKSDR